jgi:hypothetical protein
VPKEEQIIAGETNKETGLATIKTIETIKSVKKQALFWRFFFQVKIFNP